jgi:large subunit ribosomal protein L9
MKVILLSDIYKHGVAGEVVDVADGFARNYLIPKKLAAPATEGELKRAEKLRATADARKAELDHRLNDLARQIDGVELVFGRRAANTGKLFGSVTTSDIADALREKTGVDINRRRISQQALRELGRFDIPVRLGTEFSPTLKVTVVREDEVQAYLAGKLTPETPGAQTEEAAANPVETVVETVKEAVENVAHAVASAVENVVEAIKPGSDDKAE